MDKPSPLGITDVVLRDAHQSLLATRMRIDDMLPIASKLDEVGFWSLEAWGGATFDACIRFIGEDPWERIRLLKQAMPKTPLQMLFRGQNILGYRHYADDVVEKFVERAKVNGIDVFRIFDALNDMRNLSVPIKAAIANDAHAQGTLSYTLSPHHNLQTWLDLAKQLEDMGAHSLCIKDMAGLLTPYTAFELVSELKQTVQLPIHMQCHATTGLSTATYLKAIEAGIDNVDTAISSMSMTYGHSPTESVVTILKDQPRDTGLNILLLEEIAAYFREVRKKYARFEGSLRGVDSRILVAQVPGGMLTNMENQLKEQNALDKMDQVLEEIPKVREDLGFIPLVTPTSQIVGTQAVLNILTQERYKTITKETEGILKGEYGATPTAVNAELQRRVLGDKTALSCRPADLIAPELSILEAELKAKAKAEGVKLATDEIDDVLTYALFPQVGFKFLKNRGDASAFESLEEKSPEPSPVASSREQTSIENYNVVVNGVNYAVQVGPGGEINNITPPPATIAPAPGVVAGLEQLRAPLAGTIFKVLVKEGQRVDANQVVLVLEAMKMETEIRIPSAGVVQGIAIHEGDAVAVDDLLLSIVGEA